MEILDSEELLEQLDEVCRTIIDIGLRKDFLQHFERTPPVTDKLRRSRYLAEEMENYFMCNAQESALYIVPNASGEDSTLASFEALNVLVDFERGFIPLLDTYKSAYQEEMDEDDNDYYEDFNVTIEDCPRTFEHREMGSFGYDSSDIKRGTAILEFTMKLFEQAQSLAPEVFDIGNENEVNELICQYKNLAVAAIIKCGLTIEQHLIRKYEITNYNTIDSLIAGKNPQLGVKYLEEMTFHESGELNVKSAISFLDTFNCQTVFPMSKKEELFSNIAQNLISHSFPLVNLIERLKDTQSKMTSSDELYERLNEGMKNFYGTEVYDAYQSQLIQNTLNEIIDEIDGFIHVDDMDYKMDIALKL